MSDAINSGLSSVIVTSAQSGEGRSSVAVGLAMAAAAAGNRVALVDANLELPKLADELRLELQHGWVDTIRAGLPIKEVALCVACAERYILTGHLKLPASFDEVFPVALASWRVGYHSLALSFISRITINIAGQYLLTLLS